MKKYGYYKKYLDSLKQNLCTLHIPQEQGGKVTVFFDNI